MQLAKHNDGRDAKCVRPPTTTTMVWGALLLAVAIIACNEKSEKSSEKSEDVFKAEIAGKEWQADSLSIQSPKENLLFITGVVHKDYYNAELFVLGLSEITAPGEYAIEAKEKSGKAEAVLFKNTPNDPGIYNSVSGTLRVTHVSASGIRGTFAAQMREGGAGRTLNIDNGRFDIDFEALIREQIKLLAGMWKGTDYSRSWITSQEGVRGAVYNPQKRRWLINKSVLEFAADSTCQALHEKRQYRWRVVRPGLLSLDGIMCSFIVMPEYLQIVQLSSGETKGYTRIHELPGLE